MKTVTLTIKVRVDETNAPGVLDDHELGMWYERQAVDMFSKYGACISLDSSVDEGL